MSTTHIRKLVQSCGLAAVIGAVAPVFAQPAPRSSTPPPFSNK